MAYNNSRCGAYASVGGTLDQPYSEFFAVVGSIGAAGDTGAGSAVAGNKAAAHSPSPNNNVCPQGEP
jgi:hypothetical protein